MKKNYQAILVLLACATKNLYFILETFNISLNLKYF